MNIHYTLSFTAPHTHYTNVTINISEINQEELVLKMPVWTPGSYLIREYSQHVDLFSANNNNGEVIRFEKVTKNKWVVETKGLSEIQVKYRFYSYEATVRTNFVDASKAALCGAATFIYVEGQESTPSTIQFEPPPTWKNIATPLKKVNGDEWLRKSDNLDQLVDSPIEIGNFETYHFKAAGITHNVAIVGESNGDNQKFIKDLENVCNVAAAIFKDKHPCEEYLFIIQNTENRYNGLEHLHSTVCQVPRWDYYPEEKYMQTMGLMSHEYFHLWNVKRIRPFALGPFNYDEENYTKQLWVMEGITSYYDDYILYQAGLLSEEAYLKMIGKVFSYVLNTPGDDEQSLTESSFDAWIKFYRRHDNSNNNNVSYYKKGATVTMALNFIIMHHSEGKYSLNDVMRKLFQDYKTDPSKGFTEEEFLNTLESFAGISLSDFFENHIYGTQPVDYAKYFAYVGIKLIDANAEKKQTNLGMACKWEEGKLIVKALDKNYGAYQSGLNTNDEIIAINNLRVFSEYDKILEQKKAGEVVSFLISREGKLQNLDITLTADKRVDVEFELMKEISEMQQIVRNKWLSFGQGLDKAF